MASNVDETMSNLSDDPSQMSVREKLKFFEKSAEDKHFQHPVFKSYNSQPSVGAFKRTEGPSSLDNNVLLGKTTSSIPLSSILTSDKQFSRPVKPVLTQSNRISYVPSRINNNNNNSNSTTSNTIKFTTDSDISDLKENHEDKEKPLYMKEFHEVFNDLQAFVVKELNEIEVRKRLNHASTMNKLYSPVHKDSEYEDKLCHTLEKLQNDVREIKESQQKFESSLKAQSKPCETIYENIPLRESAVTSTATSTSTAATHMNNIQAKKKYPAPPPPTIPSKKPLKFVESEIQQKKLANAASGNKKDKDNADKDSILSKMFNDANSQSSIDDENKFQNDRDDRKQKLEMEIYKEETIMMKINRVLEEIKEFNANNVNDIINIERHYLVASTRFQSALTELRKLDNIYDIPHMVPFNRKGKLYVREIMLNIKPNYFAKDLPVNDYVLVMMKYEDKVYATKPIQIKDDIRVIRFPEKFSIPETYMDFDMRLEIYGTTFWRQSDCIRPTILKKYGFVTFTLVDTGNKAKKLPMIEVLQSGNVPIKEKIILKVSQKITTNIKYKGNLYVKVQDSWYYANCLLNGHILELTFKKTSANGINRSNETILLDLYNIDSDAAIPVESRVSEKPYSFLLKFNHYVDVANFYLMVAAENSDGFSEWISAINKVLILIK